eukprot:gnl/MRDRNA2_/MRDRNA2_60742_c0_seq1.p1 gnl/MRDRNA2_/MRDRNA2_60742_c0~~gnl/MRDRNA2_/MRDRNA2_60742_c0_seq1.p1  ORF type:complete len:208 (+),score=35.30 gnl/MRDRNA2_/MRDRNA2_60742_c0_seq1:58-681(+)
MAPAAGFSNGVQHEEGAFWRVRGGLQEMDKVMVRQAMDLQSPIVHELKPGAVVQQSGPRQTLPNGLAQGVVMMLIREPKGWVTVSAEAVGGIAYLERFELAEPQQEDHASHGDSCEGGNDRLDTSADDVIGAAWKVIFPVVKLRETCELTSPELPGEFTEGSIVVQSGPIREVEGGILRMPVQPRGWITLDATKIGGPRLLERIHLQ